MEEEEKKKERTAGQEVEVEVEEGDEDERLLKEFEDEMADMSVPSSKIEEIKEEMQKEFDNIIEEVRVITVTACMYKSTKRFGSEYTLFHFSYLLGSAGVRE